MLSFFGNRARDYLPQYRCPVHERELLHLVCLDAGCIARGMLCQLCIKANHQKHETITFKRLVDSLADSEKDNTIRWIPDTCKRFLKAIAQTRSRMESCLDELESTVKRFQAKPKKECVVHSIRDSDTVDEANKKVIEMVNKLRCLREWGMIDGMEVMLNMEDMFRALSVSFFEAITKTQVEIQKMAQEPHLSKAQRKPTQVQTRLLSERKAEKKIEPSGLLQQSSQSRQFTPAPKPHQHQQPPIPKPVTSAKAATTVALQPQKVQQLLQPHILQTSDFKFSRFLRSQTIQVSSEGRRVSCIGRTAYSVALIEPALPTGVPSRITLSSSGGSDMGMVGVCYKDIISCHYYMLWQYGRGVYGLNNNGHMSSHSNKSDDGNYIGVPGQRGDLTVEIDPSTGNLTFAQMGKVIITQQTSINPSSPAFHFFAAMGPGGQAAIVDK